MSARELAAEYVLGELDAERRAEVERRMESDTELRVEVEAMTALGAELGALPEEAWPGAGVLGSGVEPEVAAAEVVRPAAAGASPFGGRAGEVERPPATSPRPRRWTLRPGYALASLLAALAVGLGAGLVIAGGSDSDSDSTSPPIAQLSLSPLPASAAGHGTVAMPEADEMLLTVSDLPPSHRGEYYELWLLGGAEAETIPVVSFHVGADGSARVRVPLPLDPAEYEFFDVSRQVLADGTAHSGDSVLRGPT